MNETSNLVSDTTERILTDLCTRDVVEAMQNGDWPDSLWQALEDSGLTLAGISEASGGAGGEAGDSLMVIRQAARYAAPLPLGETFVAAKLLESTGAMIPSGPLTIAPEPFTLERERDQFTLLGSAANVPFASACHHLVVSAELEGEWKLCYLPVSASHMEAGTNMAGEPRDTLSFDCAMAPGCIYDFEGDDPGHIILTLCALVRSVMMAGALESVLEMSVRYALERQQFGRPIAKFQAIQQQLAVLAGEVAVCQRTANALVDHVDDLDPLEIAVAKARIGEAVAVAADIAHQVHGAMGYTREHELNLRTRRLWSWRDEYGNETYWQRRLGEAVVGMGADNVWPFIAATN